MLFFFIYIYISFILYDMEIKFDWLIDWLMIDWLIDWLMIDWLIDWLIGWLGRVDDLTVYVTSTPIQEIHWKISHSNKSFDGFHFLH